MIAEWTHTDGTSAEARDAVLRVLTSGDDTVTKTLLQLAYERRSVLGAAWWRLLELALLWCALMYLAPRRDDADAGSQRWTRRLRWLRTRSLSQRERPQTASRHWRSPAVWRGWNADAGSANTLLKTVRLV